MKGIMPEGVVVVASDQMTKFQKWLLGIIAKKAVVQGDHKRRIIEFYGVLIDAAREEFSEYNKPTLDDFLQECHQKALDR
jgi:hypothetical protein